MTKDAPSDAAQSDEPAHEIPEEELLHFVYQHPMAHFADPISGDDAYAVDVMRIMSIIVQLKAAALPPELRQLMGLDVFRGFAHALATGGDHPARRAFDVLRQEQRRDRGGGHPDPDLVEAEMRLKLDAIAQVLALRDKRELQEPSAGTAAAAARKAKQGQKGKRGPAAQIGLGGAGKALVERLRRLPRQGMLTERIIREFGKDEKRWADTLKRQGRDEYRVYWDRAREYRDQLRSLSIGRLFEEAESVVMATASPTATFGQALAKKSVEP